MSSYSKSRGYRGSGFRKGGLTKKRSSPSDDDTAPRASKKAKDGSDAEDDAPLIPKLLKDDDGNDFVNLKANGTRRATVHEFKGSTLVSIREYYKDDKGVLKPGKKGISLTMEQYNALLAAAPLLESVLKGKEENVARPDYGAALASEKVDGDTSSKGPVKTASDTEEGDDED